MSRAFVKESDDALEALPELALSPHPNYVTPRGLAQLRERLSTLLRKRAELEHDANVTVAAATLAQVRRQQRWLEARIAGAIEVDPAGQPRDRVTFGASVRLLDEDAKVETYTIVGEDEADAERGLVSWLSPLAEALIGARIGDEVKWRRPAGDRLVEVTAIG